MGCEIASVNQASLEAKKANEIPRSEGNKRVVNAFFAP
jgi:hypothetical protein